MNVAASQETENPLPQGEPMTITLRKATAADKPHIAKISAQIWDGEDYVADVVDDWLTDPSGEMIVAIVDGKLVSFARRSYLLPGYAWFEGARTDPAYRNIGVFQAISRHFLEAVQREGADTIGLSTHIDNKASIHIIEKSGFRKAASYIYLEVGRDVPVRNNGIPSGRVVEVMPEEAISFICSSGFLEAAHGHLPHGWKFYPFERDPNLVLSKMDHLLGIEQAGRLIGLLCVGKSLRQEQDFTVDFIDGRADAVEELIKHALHLALGHRSVEMMIPKDEAGQAPAIAISEHLGFKAYNGFAPDVFLYERKP